MLSPKSPEDVLKSVLPLLLVAIALLGGIFLLPRLNQTNLDDRSRASEPTTSTRRSTIDDLPNTPEVVCSSLYEPVCGSDNRTYPNACEANLAKITKFTPGECNSTIDDPRSTKPILLPNSN